MTVYERALRTLAAIRRDAMIERAYFRLSLKCDTFSPRGRALTILWESYRRGVPIRELHLRAKRLKRLSPKAR